MKNLFIPVSASGAMNGVMDLAIAIARPVGARLSGIGADGPFGFSVTPIQFVGEADVAYLQARAQEEEVKSEKLFVDAMIAAGAPRLSPGDSGFGFDWVSRSARNGLSVPEHARVYDLILVARRGKDAAPGQAALVDECLFESGKPVLVVPPERGKSFGEHIAIAWNASSETARTVAMGVELLRAAKKVSVIGVESVGVAGPGVAALTQQLVRNGIPATAHNAPLRGRNGGQAFLEEAIALGADMMFKGAYTQSRLRQMVFGGATAYLLDNVTMPMFMAH